ncbi:MAG: hypothetical protein L6R35_000105 [Caloplaca aegaea]|nr:MAG: hypothetical protein L6R35_000105 [Caloplaca aegaea]
MTLLENHLEQISLSAAAIAELPFPPPKRFANALLRSPDITALIRDTEAHERALFSYATPDPPSLPRQVRRNTTYGSIVDQSKFSNGADLLRPGHKLSAVTTILGGELGEQLRNEGTHSGKERGEVDARVSKISTQLATLSRSGDSRNADDEYLDQGASSDLESGDGRSTETPITAEQLEREEQEVRELERKKQNLEVRVIGMERDLGGLLR